MEIDLALSIQNLCPRLQVAPGIQNWQSSWATLTVYFPGASSCWGGGGGCKIAGAFRDASSESRGLGKQGWGGEGARRSTLF